MVVKETVLPDSPFEPTMPSLTFVKVCVLPKVVVCPKESVTTIIYSIVPVSCVIPVIFWRVYDVEVLPSEPAVIPDETVAPDILKEGEAYGALSS